MAAYPMLRPEPSRLGWGLTTFDALQTKLNCDSLFILSTSARHKVAPLEFDWWSKNFLFTPSERQEYELIEPDDTLPPYCACESTPEYAQDLERWDRQRLSWMEESAKKHGAAPAKRPSSQSVWSLLLSTILVLAICSSTIYLQPAFGASTEVSTALPYESWLSDFQKSLTGPVAFAISLIGIVVSGISLILGGGEIRGFARTMVYIVLVMTLLIGANSLMSNFFNGAAIPLPEDKPQVAPKAQTDPAHVLRSKALGHSVILIPHILGLSALEPPRFDSYQAEPWEEVTPRGEKEHAISQQTIFKQANQDFPPQQLKLAARN